MEYTISPAIKGLIFDFDGTIVDSMPVHLLSWRAAFAKYDKEFSSSFFYAHAGVSLPGVVETYNRTYGTKLEPALIVAAKDAAHVEYLPQTQLIPSVYRVIERYFGKLPMAIATGNSRNLTLPLINRLNLLRFFEAVIYGDDVTHPKPHPECFLKAAAAIGVAPEHCEVFEDGNAGLEGAARAGMKATDIRPWLVAM